jgi:hypothetical protein
MSDEWGESGAYGGNLEPLIELNDQDTWTDLKGCCLLLARPEELDNARKAGRRPHRYIGERRQFDLMKIVLFAREHDFFAEDQDGFDEGEPPDED